MCETISSVTGDAPFNRPAQRLRPHAYEIIFYRVKDGQGFKNVPARHFGTLTRMPFFLWRSYRFAADVGQPLSLARRSGLL
jgi:hypothetical protein